MIFLAKIPMTDEDQMHRDVERWMEAAARCHLVVEVSEVQPPDAPPFVGLAAATLEDQFTSLGEVSEALAVEARVLERVAADRGHVFHTVPNLRCMSARVALLRGAVLTTRLEVPAKVEDFTQVT